MNECIVEHNGEIDKLIGDAIMALFNKPEDALMAAISMMHRLKEFNKTQTFSSAPIKNGIGINIGSVSAGNIGSKEKLDYTVIGSSVNAASRFEALTKQYRLPIVVSEVLIKQLRKPFLTRFIDCVFVKGQEHPVNLYEVYDFNTTEQITCKKETEAELQKAFSLYSQGDFKQALELYTKLDKNYGHIDGLLAFYKTRTKKCLSMKKAGQMSKWEGIYCFTE